MNRRDKIITITTLVLLVVFLVYRYATTQNIEIQDAARIGEEAVLREISVESYYGAPRNTVRHVRYSIFVDSSDVIQDISSFNLNDPSHQSHLDEFSETLIEKIKGKKLSELENIDKVGTASLTTTAFNDSLERIKSQI